MEEEEEVEEVEMYNSTMLMDMGSAIMSYLCPVDWDFDVCIRRWHSQDDDEENIREPGEAGQKFFWSKEQLSIAANCRHAFVMLATWENQVTDVEQPVPPDILVLFYNVGKAFIKMRTRIDWRFIDEDFVSWWVKKNDKKRQMTAFEAHEEFLWTIDEVSIVLSILKLMAYMKSRYSEFKKYLAHSDPKKHRSGKTLAAAEPSSSSKSKKSSKSTKSSRKLPPAAAASPPLPPPASVVKAEQPPHRRQRRSTTTINDDTATTADDDDVIIMTPAAVAVAAAKKRKQYRRKSRKDVPIKLESVFESPSSEILERAKNMPVQSLVRTKRDRSGVKHEHRAFTNRGDDRLNGIPSEPNDSQKSCLSLQQSQWKEDLFSVCDYETRCLRTAQFDQAPSDEIESVLERFRSLHFWRHNGKDISNLPGSVRSLGISSSVENSDFFPKDRKPIEYGADYYNPFTMSREELIAKYKREQQQKQHTVTADVAVAAAAEAETGAASAAEGMNE